MTTQKKQQEIMLVTTTTFSKRQWCKMETAADNQQTHTEQLEEACWNGLLYEMLPEIMKQTPSGRRLFLWHIRQGASLLKLELTALPGPFDAASSIDAAAFLPTRLYN